MYMSTQQTVAFTHKKANVVMAGEKTVPEWACNHVKLNHSTPQLESIHDFCRNFTHFFLVLELIICDQILENYHLPQVK